MSSIQDLFDVRDARVVVTGAASGLGLAMAEVMADAGALVTLADLEVLAGRLLGGPLSLVALGPKGPEVRLPDGIRL